MDTEENKKKNSDAKIRANNKYRNSHYKSISIMISPEIADDIKATARSEGKSLAQYIVDLHKNHKDSIK